MARKPHTTIRIDTLSRDFSGKERQEMGSTTTSVGLYLEKIRNESKRAKFESMDPELLQVMRFIFNDQDER